MTSLIIAVKVTFRFVYKDNKYHCQGTDELIFFIKKNIYKKIRLLTNVSPTTCNTINRSNTMCEQVYCVDNSSDKC